MREPILDFLNRFLVPFVLAVPLAVLLLIVFRRGDDRGDHRNHRDDSDRDRDRDRVERQADDSQPQPQPQSAAAGRGAVSPSTTAVAATVATPSPGEPMRTGDAVDDAAAPAVLVADDSAVARAKLRRLFEGAGFRVQLASDGAEALEALSSPAHGPHKRFAVLVTDLEMPNMNGVELIAAVQGSLETEDLPIIAITGHDEMHARVSDIAGLYGLFKKPWNDRDLLKRVTQLAALARPTV